MPVSVNAVMRESLASSSDHGQLLQTQIASATKHLVLKTIEYEEYPENFLAQNDALKAKYILLSANDKGSGAGSLSIPMVGKKALASHAAQNGTNGLDFAATSNGLGATTPKKEANKNELPVPKRILFPRDKVHVGWKGSERKWQIGAGFINVGNTCYLNSTLQALLHVPAMANWLASDGEHRERCCGEYSEMCIICAVSVTLLASQKASSAVKPWHVYSRLKSICKHLMPGRQEDAHEFLRYLIEAMEKAYLQRLSKAQVAALDQYSKETTPLNQILGGYLRSSVRCLSCNHISITFQHFEDLLLDIRKANTVDEALQGYFSREKLEDMGYNCEGCKKKVTATKQFSLERPPVVLCLQLKRFSMQGTKLNKQVSIKSRLDLTQYVRKGGASTSPLHYRLVSMVTHLGSSQHCGHYTAIGVTESGMYYQFDDSIVNPISLQNVLQTNAYIIFYELENASMHRNVIPGNGAIATNGNHSSLPATITLKSNSMSNGATAAKQPKMENGNGDSSSYSRFIGPVLPPNHSVVVNKDRLTNGDGHGSDSTNNKKQNLSLTNGHGNDTVGRMNKSAEAAASSTSTVTSPGIVKKYPSAELLFKSPTKQLSAGSLNGNHNKTNGGGGGGGDERSLEISPKSLVPYSSTFSSDDDDEDDNENNDKDNNRNQTSSRSATASPITIPSPAMKNGGNGHHFAPYVNSNSGPWKVVQAVDHSEKNGTSPVKGNGSMLLMKSANHQNGSAKVLNELLKQDHNAYGGVAVSTWSGQKSSLDKEISSEKLLKRQAERKADDEEMDRGHVKKIKLNNKVGRDNPGYNAFQEYQNKQQSLPQGMQGNGGNYHRQWVNNGQMYNKSQSHHHRPGHNGNGGVGGNHHNRHSHFNKRPRHWQNPNRHKHGNGNNGGGGRFNNKNNFNGNGRKSNGGFRHNSN